MERLQAYRGMLVTAVIALAVGIASYIVVRSDPYAQRENALFTLDLSSLYRVDPNLIQFKQTAEVNVPLEEARALAVSTTGEIYVAGDRQVHVIAPDGGKRTAFPTEGRPTCLAVGAEDHASPGRIYVGAGRRIELFESDGKPAGYWDVPGANVLLTSIAVAETDVFVADAANRVVLRFDPSGRLVGKIGSPDTAQKGRTFNVPSSYFDIAVSAQGLVHVANPGVLRIESYTFDGEMEIRWGEAGSGIDEFFGCCNPSHFAVLPTGEIVTSEKGVPRIKAYSQFGEFACVVAGPEQLDVAESELGDPRAIQAKAIFDVATDNQGRVFVLDPRRKTVRIFTRSDAAKDAG